jgi:hypothetical protein
MNIFNTAATFAPKGYSMNEMPLVINYREENK